MTHTYPPHQLSKSQLMTGLQCPKALFLSLKHPELAAPSDSLRIEWGHQVGALAREQFPGGVFIDRFSCDPYQETQRAMRDPAVDAIYEASFSTSKLNVSVDILRREWPGWVITEVKSSTQAKKQPKDVQPHHVDDVAIQALCLELAGIKVTRCELMFIDNTFTYQGDNNYQDLFATRDITALVNERMPEIWDRRLKMDVNLLSVLDNPSDIKTGSQCKKPHPCAFKKHCLSLEPRHTVSALPKAAKKIEALRAMGIDDIRDIPEDFLTSKTHQWIREVTINGQETLKPGAKQAIENLGYPRYYPDFETISFAIPRWIGTKPYQQIPFQWSCHIDQGDGELLHKEFLDVTGQDPRRAFAESLIAACGNEGPVIVYNQSAEKTNINKLAEAFPDLSASLQGIADRIVDLLVIVKDNYYHPDMNGSWSIKNVLPHLVPGRSYKDLGSVQEGTGAQEAYIKLIEPGLTAEERAILEKDLKDYCAMDTLSMVEIVEAITRK